MFALSTSWNAWRYSQAKDIIKEIKGLGFDCVELNFNLTSLIVDEIIRLKDRGVIEVASLHNFCPVPKGILRKQALPDTFSLSALDEKERQQAIRYTKRTIDTASRLEAEAVVLHLGKVEMKERIRELASIHKSKDRQRYARLKNEMTKERKSKSKRFFTQTLNSLEQLCNYAQRRKVKLGIENRYYFNEIPAVEEMESILSVFSSPPLYYWHDVGHAQVYENLEFIKHKTLLDKFSQRMIGIHLHDIDGIDDHRAPLKGKFDFSLLKPYLKPETLKVLEPHHPATAREIIRGRNYLEKLFKNDT
ncbi:MAG: sugar phosphate isomerase/epimerase [Candidatus Omnitrophica bacterium]|nr:sugar phosphate isomerase/epimerase [Candidatus Omnitrophota bacterium]